MAAALTLLARFPFSVSSKSLLAVAVAVAVVGLLAALQVMIAGRGAPLLPSAAADRDHPRGIPLKPLNGLRHLPERD